MNLTGFFPSAKLGWYVARMFLLRSFVILAMLVLVLQTLDLLGESGKILAVQGNAESDVWHCDCHRLSRVSCPFPSCAAPY